MKKSTLGVRLRRTIDANREARLEQVLEEGVEAINASEDHQSEEMVRQLFESAKRRIARLIETGGSTDISVKLGQQGAAVTVDERDQAVDALARSCWPLTISEGLERPENCFNEQWRRFCRWALREELVPELYALHDEQLVRVRYYVRVRPLPD